MSGARATTPSTTVTAAQLAQFRALLLTVLPLERWRCVGLFGSRVDGHPRPGSDADLWIDANPSLTPSERVRLEEAFEESALPFRVDIVTPERLPQGAVAPPECVGFCRLSGASA